MRLPTVCSQSGQDICVWLNHVLGMFLKVPDTSTCTMLLPTPSLRPVWPRQMRFAQSSSKQRWFVCIHALRLYLWFWLLLNDSAIFIRALRQLHAMMSHIPFSFSLWLDITESYPKWWSMLQLFNTLLLLAVALVLIVIKILMLTECCFWCRLNLFSCCDCWLLQQ